jgi:hypothetical protein
MSHLTGSDRRLPSAVSRLTSGVRQLTSAICELTSATCELTSATCELTSGTYELTSGTPDLTSATCRFPTKRRDATIDDDDVPSEKHIVNSERQNSTANASDASGDEQDASGCRRNVSGARTDVPSEHRLVADVRTDGIMRVWNVAAACDDVLSRGNEVLARMYDVPAFACDVKPSGYVMRGRLCVLTGGSGHAAGAEWVQTSRVRGLYLYIRHRSRNGCTRPERQWRFSTVLSSARSARPASCTRIRLPRRTEARRRRS